MAKRSKRQRQYKKGVVYVVQGPAKRKRRLAFQGTMKLEGKEFLTFRTLRKAKKRRD